MKRRKLNDSFNSIFPLVSHWCNFPILTKKKKGMSFFFFFLSCFTLNINVIKNPPVLALKCFNRSPTSGLSCSRAQCARVDRFILWQIYKVAAEMNWNIVEIYEYGHTLFLIWKCWRLSCEPEVDSFGFLFTNVQNRAENSAVALTPTDECVCVCVFEWYTFVNSFWWK